MSNYIKNLVATSGWKEVESMFEKAISDCRNEVVDDTLPGDAYKSTSIGNIKGAKKMRALLNKIKLAGGTITTDKIKYE